MYHGENIADPFEHPRCSRGDLKERIQQVSCRMYFPVSGVLLSFTVCYGVPHVSGYDGVFRRNCTPPARSVLVFAWRRRGVTLI